MTGFGLTALALVSGGAAFLITGAVRRYALARQVIDYPNARSAHKNPTPRGGGLSIVASFLASLAVLAAVRGVQISDAIGIGGCGLIVAIIGFLDDHGHVPARWRLLTHFIAAAWVLSWLGGVPAAEIVAASGIPISLIYFSASLLIVWLINLYNFMDGIDGIASVETITATFGGAIISALLGHSELMPIQIILVASVSGFLVWNWPQAMIFMGDVGSGFLGAIIAGLILLSGRSDPTLLFVWLILLAVFLVDSGLTLLRRALRGERLYEAHAMHGYQHSARLLGSHAKVTLTIASTNLLWLFPLAIIAAVGSLRPITAMLVAYAPLTALAWCVGAGRASQGCVTRT